MNRTLVIRFVLWGIFSIAAVLLASDYVKKHPQPMGDYSGISK